MKDIVEARQLRGDENADFTADAFEAFVRQNYSAVYAYVARRIARGDGEVSDVVAEVFTVAWRRWGQVPEPPDDVPWLFGVARRLVSRWWRSRSRRFRLLARVGLHSVEPLPTTGSQEMVTDWVLDGISRLRTADQELLRLVYWEQLSHRDVGLVLGCSANAVGQRLHKVKRRLERELRDIAAWAATIPDINEGQSR
jgi:RNA polymerase sigma-70 factor (ECF subfamily)